MPNLKGNAYFKFLTDSGFMLASSVVVNLANYVFHIGGARLLSVQGYGVLQTVINLINTITVVSVIIRIQFTKQYASYFHQGKANQAYGFFWKSTKLIVTLGMLVLLGFMIIASKVKLGFGNVTSEQLLVVLIVSLLTMVLANIRAVMRGELKIWKLATNTNFQSIARVVVIIPLLYFGFKIQGAVWGLVLVYILSVAYGALQIKEGFVKKSLISKNINLKSFSKESVWTMVGFLGLTSLISTDLLLVQKYLSSDAGFYSGLMLFGKAIIFSTTPLSAVIIPTIIASKKMKDKKNIIILAIVGSVAISSGILAIYYFFPLQIIRFAVSDTYLVIIPYLVKYSIFVVMYSLCYLIVNGFIGISNYFPSKASFVAAVFQLLGIIKYHQNIGQIVDISLLVTLALLSVLVFYFGRYFYGKQS